MIGGMDKPSLPLTLEKLQAVPEGALIHYLWALYYELELCAPRNNSNHDDLLRALPPGLRLVVTYTLFDGGLLNGGYLFFFDYPPASVDEILLNFERIGAVESARRLRLAKELYQKPLESDEDYSAFEKLDEAYNTSNATYHDFLLLEKYLRDHLDQCLIENWPEV